MTRPMIYLVIIAITLSLAVLVHAKTEPESQRQEHAHPDHARLVKCWQQIENWDGHSIGAHGERGYFQFKEDAWRQVSHRAFSYAGHQGSSALAEQRLCALQYVRFLETALDSYGMTKTVYNFALCWRAGPENVRLWKNITAEERDYAHRCQNLYYDNTNR